MVRKWIIILTIAVALVIGCVWETKFVNDSFDELVDNLYIYQTMLEKSGENINTVDNIAFIDGLHDNFHQTEKVLKALIWHTGLKDVEVGMSRILTYVQENDKTEALVETNALIDYCEHYSLDFSLLPENIL